MGRIYEERGSPEHLRWFWSILGILAKPPDVRTDSRAPTLEAAKADFKASWRKWLAWAKLSDRGDCQTLILLTPPSNVTALMLRRSVSD